MIDSYRTLRSAPTPVAQSAPLADSITPPSIDSNAGFDSLSASLSSWYWPRANISRAVSRTASGPPEISTLTLVTSLVAWVPIFFTSTLSGAMRWLTRRTPTGCNTSRLASSSFRSVVNRLAEAGSSATQLSAFLNSSSSGGMSGTGGRTTPPSSPNVTSTSTEISKKSSSIEAEPLIFHGVGPESDPRRCTPQTPTPKTLTEKPVAITTSKYSGEKRSSASNEKYPSTLSASKPKNMSAFVPNCTELVVMAK